MVDAFNFVPGDIVNSFLSADVLWAKVLLLTITIALVALFIFNFYRSISRKNLLELNLKKYNRYEHPSLTKLFAVLFYLLEYIVITPFLIILWFSALAIILLLIAGEQTIAYILLITAAMIGATRILSYVHEQLAQDLAKLFPFITLSVFLLTPSEFDFSHVLGKLAEVPYLLSHIYSYLLVVIVIEVVLRLVSTVYEFWQSGGGVGEKGKRSN